MIRKEDLEFLRQLIYSLESAEKNLEESFLNNNLNDVNVTKNFILNVQKKISEVLERN